MCAPTLLTVDLHSLAGTVRGDAGDALGDEGGGPDNLRCEGCGTGRSPVAGARRT